MTGRAHRRSGWVGSTGHDRLPQTSPHRNHRAVRGARGDFVCRYAVACQQRWHEADSPGLGHALQAFPRSGRTAAQSRAKGRSCLARSYDRDRHRRCRANGGRPKIVTVDADAPWVDTGLSIASGQHLWADTRSDGTWSGNPKYFPYSDANGLPVYPGAYRIDAGAQVDSLIGFVGSTPVNVPEVSVGASAKPGGPGGVANPGFVAVGDTLTSFAPSTTGAIWLRNNDSTNYYRSRTADRQGDRHRRWLLMWVGHQCDSPRRAA